MTTKHTTVILPNSQIESLKEQVRQLTAERDEFQRQVNNHFKITINETTNDILG